MFDTIEHIWNPREVITRLLDNIKPNGYLILSTPDAGSLTAKLLGKRWAFMTPPEHLSFSPDERYRQCLLKQRRRLFTLSLRASGPISGFYSIKATRVGLIPTWLSRIFNWPILDRIPIYVPTKDVVYCVARKHSENPNAKGYL